MVAIRKDTLKDDLLKHSTGADIVLEVLMIK